MVSLRFLSFSDRVQAPTSYDFIADFTCVLIRLGAVTKPHQLELEARTFFSKAFGIAAHRIHVGVMPKDHDEAPPEASPRVAAAHQTVEHFFARYPLNLGSQTTDQEIPIKDRHPRLLVRDDLEFDRFHAANTQASQLIGFLDALNADLFIPIHDRSQALGYIIVDTKTSMRKFSIMLNSIKCLFLLNTRAQL